MATLYENYITGDDNNQAPRGAKWWAQTFTPATAHTITSVKLLLERLGNPGTITVSIKATDINGHPTGDDLCVGTTDGNTLPTTPPEWREITLGAGAILSVDVKYAIVVRDPTGDDANTAEWWDDSTSPSYTGGCLEYSLDSGASWTSYTGYDFLFEDWGEPLGGATPDWRDPLQRIASTQKIISSPSKLI